jgi:hypothetical protein
VDVQSENPVKDEKIPVVPDQRLQDRVTGSRHRGCRGLHHLFEVFECREGESRAFDLVSGSRYLSGLIVDFALLYGYNDNA